MVDKCRKDQVVSVGEYSVLPRIHNGRAIIDQRTKTASGANFFRALKRDRFLALDPKARIEITSCAHPQHPTFQALESYLNSWNTLCMPQDEDRPGTEPCLSLFDAVEKYVENRYGNIDTLVSLPHTWKTQLAAQAKQAGGRLDTASLDATVRGLLLRVTERAVKAFEPYRENERALNRKESAMLTRLGNLVGSWIKATPSGKPDLQLQERLKALDTLREHLAVIRTD